MTKSNEMNVLMKKQLLIPFGIIAASFVLLYGHTLEKLMRDWLANDNYSHGFFIPLISGYFIWLDRKKLAGIETNPSNAGLIALAASLALYTVANIGAELFTMRISMIFTLLSLSLYLAGREFCKAVLIPALYLVFMIPLPAILWNKIAFPLKLFATKISVEVIKMLGIPVYGEGNVIHLANTVLEVVDACSGLRSLTTLLALGAAFAMISELSKAKKTILFISAVPIAIFVNILRLTSTAVLTKYYGPEVAHGFLHDFSGIIVFLFAIIILFVLHHILKKPELKT